MHTSFPKAGLLPEQLNLEERQAWTNWTSRNARAIIRMNWQSGSNSTPARRNNTWAIFRMN